MKTDGTPAGMTAGYNSTLKLIKSGGAEKVYLACDSSDTIKHNVRETALQYGAALDETYTMQQLKELCGIDVGCAVCAARKQ